MCYLKKTLLITVLLVSELCLAPPVHGAPIHKTASKESKRTQGRGVLNSDGPRRKGVGEYGAHFQGDILLPGDGQINRAAIRQNQHKWPRATLYYQFADHVTEASRGDIEDAMRTISCKTCIQFVNDREPEKQDYILITTNEVGCFAFVGRELNTQVKYQKLNLENRTTCDMHGIIIHELMHAVGFEHEQSRPDRDAWVRIRLKNVIDSAKPNFQKENATDYSDYGVPYDYGSIMHYGLYSYAIDETKATIVTLQPTGNVTIGQRNGLSPSDILQTNLMYNCTVV